MLVRLSSDIHHANVQRVETPRIWSVTFCARLVLQMGLLFSLLLGILFSLLLGMRFLSLDFLLCFLDVHGVDDQAHQLLDVCMACETSLFLGVFDVLNDGGDVAPLVNQAERVPVAQRQASSVSLLVSLKTTDRAPPSFFHHNKRPAISSQDQSAGRVLPCTTQTRSPTHPHDTTSRLPPYTAQRDLCLVQCVCFFVLGTIRTGTMRVIHITVKTEETQRLRIKFVLYCPTCAST